MPKISEESKQQGPEIELLKFFLTMDDKDFDLSAAVDNVHRYLSSSRIDPIHWINKPVSPKGLTVLYKAIRESPHIGLISPLLKAGADITYLTKTKRNAFHYAVKQENLDILKLLLSHLSQMTDLTAD